MIHRDLLKHQPASNHPHWDMVLNHCGELLEVESHSLATGGDYLRLWIACLIRHEDEKLPYLFLTGPQNSGKSILHEAISLLVRGVTSLDPVLRDKEFTPRWAILGYIEEMPAHKYRTRLSQMLYEGMHIIQCASEPWYCPFRSDDPQPITIITVPPLANEIPKADLLPLLDAEGPQFLRTLMDMELPEPGSNGFRLPHVKNAQVQFTV